MPGASRTPASVVFQHGPRYQPAPRPLRGLCIDGRTPPCTGVTHGDSSNVCTLSADNTAPAQGHQRARHPPAVTLPGTPSLAVYTTSPRASSHPEISSPLLWPL